MAGAITFDEALTQGSRSASPSGLRERGNIDLHNRPRVQNSDGTFSTVRSMSFGTDRGEVLVPTISEDGRTMSDDEAMRTYQRTGKHLGIFDSPKNATAYAQSLHETQAKQYGSQPITFNEAVMQRAAASSNSVDIDRLGKAQAIRDLGYNDPRDLSNPEVPIDGFMRHSEPSIEPARSANFGQALRTSLIGDMQTQNRNAADHLFPGDPRGPSRVGTVDGAQVYVDEAGKMRRVSSPWASFTGGVLGNAPETVGSVVGSFATGFPILGSAAGAAGGRALKRGASALIFGEPTTPVSVGKEMGVEAATDAAGGLFGKGIAKFADRGRVVDFSPENRQAAESTVSRLKNETGIDLDLAQASGNRKLISIRAYAARFPGRSAELLQAADEVQRGQLDTAVSRVMDSIARAAPAEVAGEKGMGAARMVIDAAKAKRDGAVRPLFQAARSIPLDPKVDATLRSNSVLGYFAGRVEKSPLYQEDLKGLGKETVGMWHAVRMELDDAISRAANEPNKVRILTQARKELTERLEAASPEFRRANARYAQITRDTIEPLEASPVGVLSRITNPKAATAAARIFSDPNVTATEIRATRASIEKADPDAWNGLVRQYIASRWNKALRETQGGEELNPAGKLRQGLIGTPADKEKVAAMLPSGSVQAFESLMEAVQAMARTPISGSNTMRDTEIRDQLKGQGAVAWKWLTSFRASLTNAAEQRALNKGTEAITEAILDPAKRSQLRQVAKMSDSVQKRIIVANILGAQSAKTWVQHGGPEQIPDAYSPAIEVPAKVSPLLPAAASLGSPPEGQSRRNALATPPRAPKNAFRVEPPTTANALRRMPLPAR